MHLAGGFGSCWNYVAGAEYLDLVSDSMLTTGRTPTAGNGQSPGTYAPAHLSIQSKAFYGLLGYKLTEGLSATFEGRYTDEDRAIIIDRYARRTNDLVTPARFSVLGSNAPNHFNYTGTLGLGGLASSFAPTSSPPLAPARPRRSAQDPARHRHRPGSAWTLRSGQPFLARRR